MTARADTATVVSIPTPRGATQSFILIKPDHPVASVILFAGGSGVLGLKTGEFRYGNFLVRSREKFAAHNYIVAVVDAPSDRQRGMNAIFRMSDEHAGDCGAVASYLKNQAAVPIWPIGTSMGTFSAAVGAIAGGKVHRWLGADIDRDAVSARVGHRQEPPERSCRYGIVGDHGSDADHVDRDDGCNDTPAGDAAKLKARLTKSRKAEIALLDGGDPPQSSPCEAFAAHGYFGIEAEAVDTIASFINSNSK